MLPQEIFDAFGTAYRLAKLLGINIQTVYSWKRKNKIPAWRMAFIEEKARELGIDLTKKS